MKVSLSLELVNAIGEYLSTKPYREVAQLINAVSAEVAAAQAAAQAAPVADNQTTAEPK